MTQNRNKRTSTLVTSLVAIGLTMTGGCNATGDQGKTFSGSAADMQKVHQAEVNRINNQHIPPQAQMAAQQAMESSIARARQMPRLPQKP